MNTFIKHNQAKKAIDFYNQIEEKSDYNKLKYEYAKALMQFNQIAKATNILTELNQKNPKLYNLELAECYAMLNKAEISCEHLQAYLEQSKKLTISEIKTNKAFSNIEQSVEWITLWKEDWYSKNELKFNDALYEFRIKNYEESINLLQDLPNNHKNNKLLALNYYATNNYKLALQHINKALNRQPKNAEYLFIKSKIQTENKQYRKALQSVNSALNADSTKADYFLLKAKICLHTNKEEEANKIITNILRFSNDAKTYSLAGKIFYYNKDYLNSLKNYNLAIENGANNPKLYIERGDVYFKSGAIDFAEKDYSMALDFFPTMGELFYKRAMVRRKQKKYNLSCSDFHKADLYGFAKADDAIKQFCK